MQDLTFDTRGCDRVSPRMHHMRRLTRSSAGIANGRSRMWQGLGPGPDDTTGAIEPGPDDTTGAIEPGPDAVLQRDLARAEAEA